MNLTSALLKQIITQEDFDTWGNLRENYLPGEYQSIHKVISTHLKNFGSLPTFEDLKLSVRDRKLQEKIFAVEAVEVDVDAWVLLEYLKNEYTQVEILDELDKFIEKTVAISAAEDNVESLQQIVLDIGDRVDLKTPEEDMKRKDEYESIRVKGIFEEIVDNVKKFKDIKEKFYPDSKIETRVSGVKVEKSQDPEKFRDFWKNYVDNVAMVEMENRCKLAKT